MATGLLGVLGVIVIGIFSRLLFSSAKSGDQMAARLLARGVLERALREGPPNWGVKGNLSNAGGKGNLYTHDNMSQTDFVYQVTPHRITTPQTTAAMGDLWEVRVVVSWWRATADPNASREGMGRVSTELSRSVYYRQ